jgi:hypothetical protein
MSQENAPLLRRFSWFADGEKYTREKRLVQHTKDIADGVAVVLRILEQDELEDSHADSQKVADAVDAGHLQRLCISSLELLADACNDYMECHNKRVFSEGAR